MIAVILKSTLILVLTAGTALVLRRRSAAIVHAIWTAGLFAALVVPGLNAILPSWSPAGSVPPVERVRAAVAQIAGVDHPAPDTARTESGVGVRAPGARLETVAFALWLLGAGIGLGAIVLGALRLGWLVMGAAPCREARWCAMADELGRTIGLRRKVQLLEHPHARFLGTWGVFRPRILIPSDSAAWTDDRIRMVLAHELAHVLRGDWPIQVLAEAARAIYWFNPLFWLAARRLRSQSEHASDDAVLRLGISRSAYAEGLLEIAGSLGRRSGPVLAVTPSFLERRLRAVLDPRLQRVAATPWGVGIIVLSALAVTLPLAALRDEPAANVPVTNKPVSNETVTNERASTESAANGQVANEAIVLAPPADLSAALRASPERLVPDRGPGVILDGPGDGAGSALQVPGDTAACPVTPGITATPPAGRFGNAFGDGPWIVNEDRSIWVWDQVYVAGETQNTLWIRPEGTSLSVSGELVGDPPGVGGLEADLECCYPLVFKSGGLRFPFPGCWLVTATAGDRRLTFVTEVRGG